MFEWVSATTRLVQWGLLAGVVAATLATSAALSVAGVAFPTLLAPVVAASIAAAAPACLDDPAHGLLAAVPTSARWRTAHRLILVVPACVIAWSVLSPVVDTSVGWPAASLPPMIALLATGVATTTVVASWRPDAAAAAGAAAPLTLATAGVWLPFERIADATMIWADHPWPFTVTAATVAVTAAGRR